MKTARTHSIIKLFCDLYAEKGRSRRSETQQHVDPALVTFARLGLLGIYR